MRRLGSLVITTEGVVFPGASAQRDKTPATPTRHEGSVGINVCHAPPWREPERGTFYSFVLLPSDR